ncbi:GNAT family N-acetyltransferase [Vibrio sp. S4M6]|uniref:GNAT family N-acetyltransferase n=1 Tax=Vibrio sinus TaxID=2946865 RepID=UPI002029BB9C|nr:GNAT family N-acetyltransferase [Vibrio sinus]MCL9783419.1 GNAT family N-acetyltransferase [Vibrio sinus]
MVEIEKLVDSHVEAVKNIRLADEQVKFAGTPEEFLRDGSDVVHLHVIKSNGTVVGFFKLDLAYSSSYSFCPEGSIGLRAFALDINQQGKGIGTEAVKTLFSYLKTNYPIYDSVYLTVNCRNPKAIACYQKGGFEDTQDTYLGGDVGPQSIMRGKIAV